MDESLEIGNYFKVLFWGFGGIRYGIIQRWDVPNVFLVFFGTLQIEKN